MANDIPQVSFFKFLLRAREIVKNPLPFHHDNFEKNGDTFKLHLGFGRHVVFSRDAAFLKYALQSNQRNYTKSDLQIKEVAKYLGKGLLTSEGAHWRNQRKLIQPAFHKKQLSHLLKTMTQTITRELRELPTDTPFAIEEVFGTLAFEVVAQSLFSGAVAPAEIKKLKYVTEASQKMLVRELRQPYLRWWFHISGLLQKHYNMVREARALLGKIISDRQQGADQKGDLLDMLLEARYEDGNAMPKEQIIDEILVLFTAGHETTCNALTFTTQLLAQHPEYQEKIRSEWPVAGIAEIPKSFMGEGITKQVLEESMRLYPPAYFIDRMNIAVDEFEGKRLSENTALLFSVIEIHRHEKHWKNPLQFCPERFQGPPNQHSGYYYPFGAGPRMCIGNNFAMFEMQLALGELLRKYDIAPTVNPIEVLPLITLRSKNARIILKKRQVHVA
ncbi:MAG: cytochrome P450 [Bacteroidota bacterium]